MPTLFGGALELALPDRFEDISCYRDVPDNQEVEIGRIQVLTYSYRNLSGQLLPPFGAAGKALRLGARKHVERVFCHFPHSHCPTPVSE